MDCIETVSSGHDRHTALVNSEQLWLPARDSATRPLFCGFGGEMGVS